MAKIGRPTTAAPSPHLVIPWIRQATASAARDGAIRTSACLNRLSRLGIPLTPLFIAIEAGLLYAVSKRWPRTAAGRKDRFSVWIAVWLVFGAIALGAHFRSAMLCTV